MGTEPRPVVQGPSSDLKGNMPKEVNGSGSGRQWLNGRVDIVEVSIKVRPEIATVYCNGIPRRFGISNRVAFENDHDSVE